MDAAAQSSGGAAFRVEWEGVGFCGVGGKGGKAEERAGLALFPLFFFWHVCKRAWALGVVRMWFVGKGEDEAG